MDTGTMQLIWHNWCWGGNWCGNRSRVANWWLRQRLGQALPRTVFGDFSGAAFPQSRLQRSPLPGSDAHDHPLRIGVEKLHQTGGNRGGVSAHQGDLNRCFLGCRHDRCHGSVH